MGPRKLLTAVLLVLAIGAPNLLVLQPRLLCHRTSNADPGAAARTEIGFQSRSNTALRRPSADCKCGSRLSAVVVLGTAVQAVPLVQVKRRGVNGEAPTTYTVAQAWPKVAPTKLSMAEAGARLKANLEQLPKLQEAAIARWGEYDDNEALTDVLLGISAADSGLLEIPMIGTNRLWPFGPGIVAAALKMSDPNRLCRRIVKPPFDPKRDAAGFYTKALRLALPVADDPEALADEVVAALAKEPGQAEICFQAIQSLPGQVRLDAADLAPKLGLDGAISAMLVTLREYNQRRKGVSPADVLPLLPEAKRYAATVWGGQAVPSLAAVPAEAEQDHQ